MCFMAEILKSTKKGHVIGLEVDNLILTLNQAIKK